MNTALVQSPFSNEAFRSQPWPHHAPAGDGHLAPLPANDQHGIYHHGIDERDFIGITTIGGAPTSTRLGLTLQPLLRLAETAGDRWLTVIADPALDRRFWRQLGLAGDTLRLLHLDSRADRLWATWEALSAGNSHTVCAAIPHLTEWEQAELTKAAQLGRSHGLLLVSNH